jgi:NAD(P)-dependent dehydrogenase (short-subunit alcohol dehydrogenase family)
MTRTWIVTGSSRGFGRELVKAALEGGDRVLATARRPEEVDDLVQEYGEHIRAAALDVTDAAAASAVVKLAVDTFGALDVVVNNAEVRQLRAH